MQIHDAQKEVGTHYMPFMFLYGMWQYAILAATLIGGGVLIGIYLANSFVVGGWLTAALLLIFSLVIWRILVKESS